MPTDVPNSPESSTTYASPYAQTIQILRGAFTLTNSNPWVADFLFADDPVRVGDLVTGVQKACAPVVNWGFEKESFEIDEENISPDPIFLDDKGDEKVSSEPLRSEGNFALLPVFSKGALSVGLRVQSCISGSPDRQFALTHCSKFVFDNEDTTFLAVRGNSSQELVNVTFMSHSIASGRMVAFLQFNGKAFRRLVATAKMSAPLLLNALLSCDVYRESKYLCAKCSVSRAEICSCAHSTTIPSHPMHFETLAPNFVLYGGQFSARKFSWKRSFAGILIQDRTISARCRIDISVNEKSVSALCDLERKCVEGVESEVCGSFPLMGQIRTFDLHEADQGIPKGPKEDKGAESKLSPSKGVSISLLCSIGKSQRKNFQERSTSIIR